MPIIHILWPPTNFYPSYKTTHPSPVIISYERITESLYMIFDEWLPVYCQAIPMMVLETWILVILLRVVKSHSSGHINSHTYSDLAPTLIFYWLEFLLIEWYLKCFLSWECFLSIEFSFILKLQFLELATISLYWEILCTKINSWWYLCPKLFFRMDKLIYKPCAMYYNLSSTIFPVVCNLIFIYLTTSFILVI